MLLVRLVEDKVLISQLAFTWKFPIARKAKEFGGLAQTPLLFGWRRVQVVCRETLTLFPESGAHSERIMTFEIRRAGGLVDYA